ncbi:tyrosine-type recombinase/integrase [Streptomyces odontomachi]|uniref:tyrosine-type recombinase/integrase n=1 Tax=Streptomyces odontomachi TaxID=2944940 RepID=UPI0027E37457|nr:tyrosine-type recombinase/integrase [Streptomyces sp. ODS25]
MEGVVVRGRGSVYKRCGCVDRATGRQLAGRCRQLSRRGHGSWYFSFGVRSPGCGGRRLRRGGYATRAEARTALTRLYRTSASQLGLLTVGEWLTSWHASRNRLRASTRRNYRSHLENHLIPLVGNVLLAELDLPCLQELFDRLAGSVSVMTAHRVRAALRTALNAAVRAGVLVDNPARHIELSTTMRPHPVVWTAERIEEWRRTGIRPSVAVWTVEQTAAFLAAISDHRLYAAFRVIAVRGLRRGEAVGLRWSDLDLHRGTLSVARQLQYQGGQLVPCPPKSRASRRTIALDPDTITALRAHQRRQKTEEKAAGTAWANSGYVFTTPTGKPLNPEVLTKHLRELNTLTGLPPVRLHDLRHGAASLMLAAGADLKVVQDVLGHSSIVLTADTYTSVLPDLAHRTAADTAELIRQAGCLVPGTARPRHREYPQRPEDSQHEPPHGRQRRRSRQA